MVRRARALEVEVTSQGHSVDEALANLREALELYFEDEALPARCARSCGKPPSHLQNSLPFSEPVIGRTPRGGHWRAEPPS